MSPKGGKRAGAGRPGTGQKYVPRSFNLTPALIRWLAEMRKARGEKSNSALVREILEAAMERQRKGVGDDLSS